MLIFKIEDDYWLTGADTDGFVIFHCLFIGTRGELTHLTRVADIANLGYSSICDEVRVWRDGEGTSKAQAIKEMLRDHGLEGAQIGIQLDAFGLLPRLYLEIQAHLAGWCQLADASDLIRELRLVKTDNELAYVRKAGKIMDEVRDVAIQATYSGAFEGDIYGSIYNGIFQRDGDVPAHVPPIGSGSSAMNIRYTTARKHVRENDQVTHELGCGYRHYHAAIMFVVLTGPKIDTRHLNMHETCVAALEAVQTAMRAGNTLGDLYEAHRVAFARHGHADTALPAVGYTMGATWPPTWMEQPQIVHESPIVLEPNMTFFTHMILTNREEGLTMSIGEQAIVTAGAPELVTHVSREPIIRP